MPHTIDLLNKALETKKAAAWCRDLNITKGAISKAKDRGRLSPTLAGVLAMEMGADPIFWTAVAAAEAEPPGPLRERLEQSLSGHNTAHYGHPNDTKNDPRNRLNQSVFCCLDTTQESDKPKAGIYRRRERWRQEVGQKLRGGPLRAAHAQRGWVCGPIERRVILQPVCRQWCAG